MKKLSRFYKKDVVQSHLLLNINRRLNRLFHLFLLKRNDFILRLRIKTGRRTNSNYNLPVLSEGSTERQIIVVNRLSMNALVRNTRNVQRKETGLGRGTNFAPWRKNVRKIEKQLQEESVPGKGSVPEKENALTEEIDLKKGSATVKGTDLGIENVRTRGKDREKKENIVAVDLVYNFNLTHQYTFPRLIQTCIFGSPHFKYTFDNLNSSLCLHLPIKEWFA